MDIEGQAEPVAVGCWSRLREPFLSRGRFDGAVLGLFIAINVLVLVNACLHPVMVGYDADAHLKYVATLSEGRLPTALDTYQYFSPPLAYALPALCMRLTDCDVLAAARVGLLINFLLSLGLTFLLLRVCLKLGADRMIRIGSLLVLGMLPVYYRTFAMVRPEPYLAFLAVCLLDAGAGLLGGGQRGVRRSLGVGALLGLALLSRQWGVFLFPAFVAAGLFCVARRVSDWRAVLRVLMISVVAGVLAGGWFFAVLRGREGSAIAFPRSGADGFSWRNQPAEFYFGTGGEYLFNHPVRPAFPNQFLPVFYSELWGDYWCYFVVAGRIGRDGDWISGRPFARIVAPDQLPDGWMTNRFRVVPYLARVNRLAVPATLFLLVGVGAGLWRLARDTRPGPITPGMVAGHLALLVVLATLAGYAWFLIRYPSPGNGDTIKASYMLQIYPCMALLCGMMLSELARRSRMVACAMGVVLGLIALHNLPACLTHYTAWSVGG